MQKQNKKLKKSILTGIGCIVIVLAIYAIPLLRGIEEPTVEVVFRKVIYAIISGIICMTLSYIIKISNERNSLKKKEN